MLIKCDCAGRRKRKGSKQGFISLVFQPAVFSLSTAGSRREGEKGRANRQGERLLMRCGGGSINWSRYGCCYSSACYPEVGPRPDLEALTYQRDSVSHRAKLLLHRPQCLTIPLQSQPNQESRISDHAHTVSALLKLTSGSSSGQTQGTWSLKGHVVW